MNRKSILAYGGFAFIMVALGASDALRGIFAPLFEEHFALTNSQLAAIVTISYVGNLCFLLWGGRLADRFPIKRVFVAVVVVWMISLGLYIMTDNYLLLLVGMFFSMGASTLLNTLMNIMTPLLFAGAPAMIVNTLFFVQGIGTTGSQKIAGMYADSIKSWKVTNLLLLGIGIVGMVLFLMTRVPETGKKTAKLKQKGCYKAIVKNPAFVYLIFILGFYFIAEHGILNWLVSYGSKELGFSVAEASGYLSAFFGCVMAGRLIFAPFVQKMGISRSISIFGGAAAVIYIAGIAMGRNGITILAVSGLFFSILYPMLISVIQFYYDKEVIATATGLIISISTLFDIGFNAFFGMAIDILGYRSSFLILPVCMALFYVCFIVFRKRVPVLVSSGMGSNKG